MNWHEYFLAMCKLVASKSKDRSIKVGAVIVGPDNEVVSTGYNGFPRGINDNIDDRHERPIKYKYTVHAEQNAIFHAARIGSSVKGCTIYVDWIPCSDCARAIIQSGIVKVIINGDDFHNKFEKWSERWAEDMKITCDMFSEVGMGIFAYDENISEIDERIFL